MQKRDWNNWNLKEWNNFLVQTFFYDGGESGGAIHQFDASPIHLARALGISNEIGYRAQEAFIENFQLSLYRLRQLFGVSMVTSGWTSNHKNLPFFAQLYLSLIVASATKETQSEGNFRARLSKLLGQEVPQNYVNCLPRLWEATQQWTYRNANENPSPRILVLPDPRHETIIGYSKRLAFPGYRDQTNLARTLTESHLSSESPVNQLIEAVGRNKYKFTSVFREEFDYFISRRDKNPNDARISETPFWRAVESTNWQSSYSSSSETACALRLELSQNSDEEVSILVAANRAYIRKLNQKWVISKGTNFHDIFTAYIDLNSDYSSEQTAITALLDKVDAGLVKPIIRTSLVRHINQGCVVFTRYDAFTWASTNSMPHDGEVCLIFLSSLARRAVKVIKKYTDCSPLIRRIQDIGDWSCIGPINIEHLLFLGGLLKFNRLEALQQTIPTSSISISNGLRLRDGWLFLPPVLPTIHSVGSDYIAFKAANGFQGKLEQINSDKKGYYKFGVGQVRKIRLPSTLELSAYAEDSLIRTKSIDLVDRCSINAYKSPTERQWLKEGEVGQFVDRNDGKNNSEGNKNIAQVELNSFAHNNCNTPLEKHGSTDPITVDWVNQESIPTAWLDIFECLAALLTQKCGIGWSQLFELIGRSLDLQDDSETSLVAETFVQNGFLQRIYNRRWKGVRFLGVQPELHIIDGPSENEKRIIGLLSSSQRMALEVFAREHNAKLEIARSTIPSIFGVTRLIGEKLTDVGQAIDINRVQESDRFEPINWLPSPMEILGKSSQRNDSKTSNLRGMWWDKSLHRFSLNIQPDIDRFTLRFQPYESQISSYSLYDSGRLIWQSEDRLWAIFLVERLESNASGVIIDDERLASMNPLPLGLSHAVLQKGAGVVGATQSNNGCRWFYYCRGVESIEKWIDGWGLETKKEQKSWAMRRWMASFDIASRKPTAQEYRALMNRYK